MKYTIILTEAQQKALECVAYDPQEWIENAVYNRCRIAIDEIVAEEVERITSQGGEISGTKEDIVLAASPCGLCATYCYFISLLDLDLVGFR